MSPTHAALVAQVDERFGPCWELRQDPEAAATCSERHGTDYEMYCDRCFCLLALASPEAREGWIDYGKPWSELATELGDSVVGLELVIGDECFLVGDVNALRGVCDDCTGFGYGDVVTRYRRVWEQP